MIVFDSVDLTYGQTSVLRNISFVINRSECWAITGKSGSGKSSLMNIIGLMRRASQGSYHLLDTSVEDLSKDKQAILRNQHIGFVFQQFNLIETLSVLENVLLPTQYGTKHKDTKAEALKRLDQVGMASYISHKPSELSGGQQQRVAIARALINEPSMLLADEPTGALDTETSRQIMSLIHKLNREEGMTVIIVTHDQELANNCANQLVLESGSIKKVLRQ